MNDTPPEPETVATLYRRAFAEYGTQALWKNIIHDWPDDNARAILKARHRAMSGSNKPCTW